MNIRILAFTPDLDKIEGKLCDVRLSCVGPMLVENNLKDIINRTGMRMTISPEARRAHEGQQESGTTQELYWLFSMCFMQFHHVLQVCYNCYISFVIYLRELQYVKFFKCRDGWSRDDSCPKTEVHNCSNSVQHSPSHIWCFLWCQAYHPLVSWKSSQLCPDASSSIPT